MYLIKRRLGLLSVLLILTMLYSLFSLLIPLSALAADNWGVYQHDSRHSGQSSYVGPDKPGILWVVPFGNTGKPSTPIAVSKEGNLYLGVDVSPAGESTETKSTDEQSVGGHSGVFAFGPNNKVLWVSQAKGTVSGPLAIGKDGTVYAVVGNQLVALKKKNGKSRWTVTLNSKSTGGVMVGEDGTIYAVTLQGKSLYAVSPSGKLKWMYTAGEQIDGSPAIGSDGTVYFSAQDLNLYAVGSDGNLKWKFRALEKATNAISAPALSKDNVVYFAASRFEGEKGFEYLYAINPDGKMKWRYQLKGKKSTMPAVKKDGSVIVSSTILNYTTDTNYIIGECYIQSIDSSGREVWTFKSRDNEIEGLVVDDNGSIYASTPDGYLNVVTKKGIMKWRAKVGGKVSIGPKGILFVAAKASVAAVADKNLTNKTEETQTARTSDEGSSSGGIPSLLIYIIPVAAALGIGYFFKSVLGSSKDKDEDSAS